VAGFVYFFPRGEGQQQKVSAEDFEAAGFAHALTGGGIECRPTTAGPDGLAGILAVPETAGQAKTRFDKAGQVWRKGPTRKVEGRDVFAYVGVEKSARPGPADLARLHVYAGNAVRLLDGNEWIVPRCHAFLEDRPPTLPRQLDVAEDGESVVTRIQPAFEQLSHDAFRFWMDWSGQSPADKGMTSAEQVKLAAAALAVNYRVGVLEVVALLGLWGEIEFGLVLRAMIDADEVETYLQKKRLERTTAAAT
jgi:hypothetical protein